MRLAYADPPYPGNAELYEDHPDYAGEVDHAQLVERLLEYDGWALSTSTKSLKKVIALCPDEVRVLAWTNHSVGRSWEPVLVMAARPIASQYCPRDWLYVDVEAFQWREKPKGYVIGRKPREFCRWVFHWLGARAGEGDTLDDLFPGSGAVTQAWEEWNVQPELVFPPGRRDVRRWEREREGWLEIEVEETG